jgi:hypothetical protein
LHDVAVDIEGLNFFLQPCGLQQCACPCPASVHAGGSTLQINLLLTEVTWKGVHPTRILKEGKVEIWRYLALPELNGTVGNHSEGGN